MGIPSKGTIVTINFPFSDLYQGTLNRESFARPGKLFTANQSIICQEIATIKAEKFNEIIQRLHQIFSRKGQ